jgi:hypothetical protein
MLCIGQVSNSKVKENKKLSNGKTTNGATAETAIASQPADATNGSQVRKDTEQKHGVNKTKTGLAEPGLTYSSPGPLEQVEVDNCPEIMKRLAYRFPRGREARIDAENLCWRQLRWEHLPVPSNDRALIEALGARWVELATMVDREAPTPEENQRVRAFLREFLILACAPESAPVPSESEVM